MDRYKWVARWLQILIMQWVVVAGCGAAAVQVIITAGWRWCAGCSAARCTLQLGVLDWSWPGRPAPSTLPTFYILFCTLTHPVHGSTPHHTSHHTHRITSSGWCLSQCLSSSHHIPSLLITHFPTILFTLTS